MKKKILTPRDNNYGLPKNFKVDCRFIYKGFEFEEWGGDGSIVSTLDELKAFKQETCDVQEDHKKAAQHFIKLPRKPEGYFLSLMVFRVLSTDDLERWNRFYPDSNMPDDDFDSFIDEHTRSVDLPDWQQEIETSVAKYFKARLYRGRPFPLLIKYHRSGCFLDNTGIEKTEKGHLYWPSVNGERVDGDFEKIPFEDHVFSPYRNDGYHKVFVNSPLRLSSGYPMGGFLMPIVSEVNRFFQDMVLDVYEWHEIWDLFTEVRFRLDTGCLDSDYIIKKFNPKLKEWRYAKSPVADFFRKHFVDYLNELSQKGLVKKCENCDSAFSSKIAGKKFCEYRCSKSLKSAKYYANKIVPKKRS